MLQGTSLELEAFHTGFKYEGSLDLAPSLGISSDVDMATFSLNPILKARFQDFQVYGGLGLGVSYIKMTDIKVTGIAAGLVDPISESDWCFTLQGIAGMDYFITQNWSLFTEYKYLALVDLMVGSSKFQERGSSTFGMHLVNAGVRYHF